MACSESKDMISIEACRATLLDSVRPLTIQEIDTVPLADAGNRILAEELYAEMDLPPADNSAMDGYALHHADLAGGSRLQVVGRSLAGEVYPHALQPGSCLRIMTGAVTPAECGAVIMQENVDRVDQDVIVCRSASASSENIRRRGEDISRGQLLLAAGRRLRGSDIGLLASQGRASVPVRRRLRVALLSSGDELVTPGQPLAAGQIYDSNRLMLAAALSDAGFSVLDLGRVADQPAALEAALREADQQADAIISSGGVSVGEADHTRDVLGRLGEIHIWKVAIKPGKPFAFGSLSRSLIFGLPGNPVSAWVTLQQLALPALRAMQGETQTTALQLPATLTQAVKKKPGRADFQRGQLHYDVNGELVVTPLPNQGSAVLTSISRANCFIVLPREQGAVGAGERVIVEPFASDL